MRRLLIPIDRLSSGRTRAAVAEAIAIHRNEPVQIHLLSVQPAVSGHVAMFFHGTELHDIHHEAGLEELASVRALLDAAGVRYTFSVAVGRSAETIARVARELGCDRIVMGRERHADFAAHLFGSLAGEVRQLVGVRGGCEVLG